MLKIVQFGHSLVKNRAVLAIFLPISKNRAKWPILRSKIADDFWEKAIVPQRSNIVQMTINRPGWQH